VWYVASGGNDRNTGTANSPLASVQQALALIHAAYTADGGAHWSWEDDNQPRPAIIVISGNVSDFGNNTSGLGMIEVTGASAYPLIVLQGGTGRNAGILNAASKGRVLYIADGNTVMLADNLTITGGNAADGGAVYIANGICSAIGTTVIEGNTAEMGGGVFIANGIFTLTEMAVIQNNTARYLGGGVFISRTGVFSLDASVSVRGNAARSGGGVYIEGIGRLETVSGTVISGNTPNDIIR
jgi:hypothetical protein